jgi:hypothetical protein
MFTRPEIHTLVEEAPMGAQRVSALLVLTAFLATACGERQTEAPTGPDLAQGGGGCNFTSTTGVVTLTKNEFGANSTEAGLATSMKNAGAGTAQATSLGYQILASIGNKYDGSQASTSNASALTVALLNCMDIGGATVPAATVFDVALGAHGALGVRVSADVAAVASHDGAWLLAPPGTQSWGSILPTGTNAILVYGVPVADDGTFTNDAGLSGIFDWSTLPHITFNAPGVLISNCTAEGYLQHNPAGPTAEILGFITPNCPSAGALLNEPAPRTLADRLFRLLRPAPAYASLAVTGTTGSKRTVSPFKVIGPVQVNLAAVGFTWKKSGNTVGKPFDPTPVYRILSSANTPFLQADVLVWLEAIGNSGVKVDICNNWAWTNANGVAQFPAAYLNKSGGYTIIAKTDGTSSNPNIPAVPAGISVLSPLVNVKNGNPGTCTTFHQGDAPPDNPGLNGKQ